MVQLFGKRAHGLCVSVCLCVWVTLLANLPTVLKSLQKLPNYHSRTRAGLEMMVRDMAHFICIPVLFLLALLTHTHTHTHTHTYRDTHARTHTQYRIQWTSTLLQVAIKHYKRSRCFAILRKVLLSFSRIARSFKLCIFSCCDLSLLTHSILALIVLYVEQDMNLTWQSRSGHINWKNKESIFFTIREQIILQSGGKGLRALHSSLSAATFSCGSVPVVTFELWTTL